MLFLSSCFCFFCLPVCARAPTTLISFGVLDAASRAGGGRNNFLKMVFFFRHCIVVFGVPRGVGVCAFLLPMLLLLSVLLLLMLLCNGCLRGRGCEWCNIPSAATHG